MSAAAAPAAAGVEQLELDLLLDGLMHAYGVDARAAPPALLHATVHELVNAAGVMTVTGLLERVLHDRAYGEMAARRLDFRRLPLFADVSFHAAFRHQVIPWLRTHPFITLWIADCGTGAEVYAMAIALAEEGLLDRSCLYATAENATALAHARSGRVSADAVDASEPAYRAAFGRQCLRTHFVARDGALALRPELLARVVWSEYSGRGGASFREFELVDVRRAGSATRRGMLALAQDSVALSGLLASGTGDALPLHPGGRRFKRWDTVTGLHQRIG